VVVSASAAERDVWIRRYADGPARLRQAMSAVPDEAVQWRPAPGKWSVHEIVAHCADSETNAYIRLRYLLAEKEPVIQAYDQDEWARRFDYHQVPLSLALQTVEAVRATTAALLARLAPADFERRGRHSESGPYGVDDWLRIYAGHLEGHAAQIERNHAAWQGQRGVAPKPPVD
jgi:hypothetical protein